MLLLHLARKSLTNRLLTTSLTALSIAFSVALLVGVENVRTGMRESFSNTVSGTVRRTNHSYRLHESLGGYHRARMG